METRTKSILILSGTLLLGMLIGGLITGTFINSRAKKMGGFFTNEKRFYAGMENLITPAPEQRDSISRIIRRYGASFAARNRTHQRGQLMLLDSLEREITPFLNQEQRERVRQRFAKMEEQRRKFFENN